MEQQEHMVEMTSQKRILQTINKAPSPYLTYKNNAIDIAFELFVFATDFIASFVVNTKNVPLQNKEI